MNWNEIQRSGREDAGALFRQCAGDVRRDPGRPGVTGRRPQRAQQQSSGQQQCVVVVGRLQEGIGVRLAAAVHRATSGPASLRRLEGGRPEQRVRPAGGHRCLSTRQRRLQGLHRLRPQVSLRPALFLPPAHRSRSATHSQLPYHAGYCSSATLTSLYLSGQSFFFYLLTEKSLTFLLLLKTKVWLENWTFWPE